MGLLEGIGKILSLIGGIIVLVKTIFDVLGYNFNVPYVDTGISAISGLIGLIITLLAAIGLIMMFQNKWNIRETWLEGVIIIILAFFASSTLALIGGILVLISGLL